jgi:spore coat polysaccharide biosynthesis protein SpsF
MNVVACITVRMSSERLPGKVMSDICGRPALARVVDRYRLVRSVTDIVVATSTDVSDDPIVAWCQASGIACYRGSLDDVCDRIVRACEPYDPDYVLRGLGDCPFIDWRLLDMAVDACRVHDADAMRIFAGPNSWPVYGAAESPYSWHAVLQINELSVGAEREHFGMHLDRYRDQYDVIYPQPPAGFYCTYYAPFRLELDTPEDLYLILEIYERIGQDREPELRDVIRLLNENPDLAMINAAVCERTGPLTTFDIAQRRAWADLARTKLVDWGMFNDWIWLDGHEEGVRAVWCDAGTCYLGYAKRTREHGRNVTHLVRPGGTVIRDAKIICSCGAGRRWYGSGKHRDIDDAR